MTEHEFQALVVDKLHGIDTRLSIIEVQTDGMSKALERLPTDDTVQLRIVEHCQEHKKKSLVPRPVNGPSWSTLLKLLTAVIVLAGSIAGVTIAL